MTTRLKRHVALIGNPNTGKTTLFNLITGLSQRTGNFPGCTVEKKWGLWDVDPFEVEVLDLPGTYSLAAISPDEMVVAETLLHLREDQPEIDAVIVVVNASCLHRNLYLVEQLRELGLPMLMALNMVDQAKAKGIDINLPVLSEELEIPIVPTNANHGEGVDALAQALTNLLKDPTEPGFQDAFSDIREEAATLVGDTQEQGQNQLVHHTFRALIDEEGAAERHLCETYGDAFAQKLKAARERVRRQHACPIEHEAEQRYQYIRNVLDKATRKPDVRRLSLSERADILLTHPVLGTLSLLFVLAIVFQAIYSWAGPLMDGIEGGVGAIGESVGAMMAPGMLQSLIVDGVIGGVGGVLVFLPQIMFLFAFIAILEDCGYLARGAFLLDRLFRKAGLSGKSLIPLVSSFACAVPGLMAARTIEDKSDRFTTVLVAPFMSCSARLPVYVIMISAFIPATPVFGPFGTQGLTLLAMYLVGIAVAVPTAFLLKRTILKGISPPFLMELPSYKLPSPRTVFIRVYMSAREFILRAGTMILAVSIVVWAAAYFPRSQEIEDNHQLQVASAWDTYNADIQLLAGVQLDIEPGASEEELLQAMNSLSLSQERIDQVLARTALQQATEAEIDAALQGAYLSQSYLGRMGKAVEGLVEPLGWDWRIGIATIASFPAREIIVATMGVLFNLGADQDEGSSELREALQSARREDGELLFNIPVALSIMVFFALCAQCAATLAVVKKETGSWLYPVLSFSYMTGLAYVGAFAIYRVALALGL